jgi:pimeloyl-ACP methyl ester carboxylesterase
MRIEFVAANGLRTRYLAAGKAGAPVLLLLHGYGASADSFIRNIDILGRDLHVIAPDMPGFGFSEGSDLNGRSLPEFLTEQIGSFLRQLSLQPSFILGHSFGGAIASNLYLRLQPRAEKLVIVCSGSVLNTDAELEASLNGLRARVPATARNLDLEEFRAHAVRLCVDPTTLPEEMLYARWISAAQPGASDFFVKGLDSLLNFESWQDYRVLNRLEKLHGKVLLIWGKQDASAPERNAQMALERIPDARLVVFDHCGHLPLFERAEAFNATVREFLLTGQVGASRESMSKAS